MRSGSATGWQSPSPSDRCRMILCDDWTLSNAEVSLRARSTPRQASAVRYELVCAGAIPPSRDVQQRKFPRHRALPHAPQALTQGACVGHPHPEWWTDPATPDDREMAKNICRWACGVTGLCVTWSLSLPVDDLAIYGATSADDRKRLRAVRDGKPTPLHLTQERRNAARNRRRAAAREQATAGQETRPA